MKMALGNMVEMMKKQDEKMNALIALNQEMWRNFGLSSNASGIQCGKQQAAILYNKNSF
jgi:hypothetical protein